MYCVSVLHALLACSFFPSLGSISFSVTLSLQFFYARRDFYLCHARLSRARVCVLVFDQFCLIWSFEGFFLSWLAGFVQYFASLECFGFALYFFLLPCTFFFYKTNAIYFLCLPFHIICKFEIRALSEFVLVCAFFSLFVQRLHIALLNHIAVDQNVMAIKKTKYTTTHIFNKIPKLFLCFPFTPSIPCAFFSLSIFPAHAWSSEKTTIPVRCCKTLFHVRVRNNRNSIRVFRIYIFICLFERVRNGEGEEKILSDLKRWKITWARAHFQVSSECFQNLMGLPLLPKCQKDRNNMHRIEKETQIEARKTRWKPHSICFNRQMQTEKSNIAHNPIQKPWKEWKMEWNRFFKYRTL